MPTRRQFLKAGLGGVAVLAVAKLAYDHFRPPPPTPSAAAVQPEARAVLDALAPVILAGALPTDPAAALAARRGTVQAALDAIAGLPPASQHELAQLFSLLTLPPTRILVAGLVRPWANAEPDDLRAVLERFRNSRFTLLQSAYQALTQLTLAAWYASPAAWPAIGYPGPPQIGR